MRLTRNMVAYKLLAMHPVIHITMLISGIMLISVNYDEFYDFDLKPGKYKVHE